MNRIPDTMKLLCTAAAISMMMMGCGPTTPKTQAPKPVFVTTVSPVAVGVTRAFLAEVRPRVESDVAFRTAGKVVERMVEVGDAVKPGQVIARLDAADYELAVKAAADQVQAASVDAQQAASDEARFRRLLADGSVAAADHERQKARADAASARLEQAQRQLALARNREGYSTLLAPFAGVVTALRFERGQVVTEGQPVVTLARDSDKEVVVELPEDWVSRARGLTATASPWNDPQTRVRLTLRELSPQATAQGRTFRARYAAAAESRSHMAALPLGSSMRLALSSTASNPMTASLPASAVLKGSGPAGVWVLDAKGSGLVFTPVQVVAVDEANVQVTGLAAGSRVVTVGAQKLDAATPVRPIERSPDASTNSGARSS